MPNTAISTGASAPPMGLAARFIGVITSPRETFQSVVAHPKWLGMLALATVTIALLVGWFLSTSVGQNAWLETMPPKMSDQQYEGMLRVAKFLGYIGALQMLVMIPLMTIVIAGILFGIFNALGGDATFKQAFAVVVHALPISVLGQLFTVPVNYARGKLASATNLAVLLPMIDEKSFLGRLLTATDLFIIWWVFVLAIGVGVLYRRRTQPIALSLFGVYAVLALVWAAIMSRLGGT
jgi:Yip1 domain